MTLDTKHRRRLVRKHAALAGMALPQGVLGALAARLEEFIAAPRTLRAKTSAARSRRRHAQRAVRKAMRRAM